jgi:HPt (histidine-containing phosphotransfer) domain-containing protein
VTVGRFDARVEDRADRADLELEVLGDAPGGEEDFDDVLLVQRRVVRVVRRDDVVVTGGKEDVEMIVVVPGGEAGGEARRRAAPTVASRSRTGSHPAGVDHGSSSENSARRTRSVSDMTLDDTGDAAHCVQRRRNGQPMVDLELDELKREFLAEADEKVREMQAALDAERTPETLERLTYLAHQLKGSGGSYGYERISTDAAELEKAVETIVENGTTKLDAKIQQHVVNLRAEIERRVRELAPATN